MPGDDLLSHTLRCSTIGAEAFHGRVRNGIGCRRFAIITKQSKNIAAIVLAIEIWFFCINIRYYSMLTPVR